MNPDYAFGNFIYEMRRKTGMSQSQLAEKLRVTNKAVSKWENGKAKPSTRTMVELAKLWKISLDELLCIRNKEKRMDITKIVITGGPCAGKTTALSWIMNAFTERGYDVLFVPETATELINGGVAPWTCKTNADYQFCQMRLQLEKEKVFEQAARVMKKDKVLIVCDRGALDNKAYMDEATFEAVLRSVNANEVELRDNYDAVFHLVTAAKGAEEFYTLANNKARTETVEEAAEMDDRFIAAWTGHPHLRVIDNSTDFTDKMKRLIAEIASFLGEPEPLEIERKFLVEYPDLKWLESLSNCEKVEIIQTYLKVDDKEEIRVRQRGSGGHYIYYQTTKRRVTEYKRIEMERRITKDEYLNLLMNADTSLGQIRKDRYCLTYDNQYFEIDVYPFWSDRAILEIELRDINDAVSFPEEIRIIKEVTDAPEYKNSYLAKHKPE